MNTKRTSTIVFVTAAILMLLAAFGSPTVRIQAEDPTATPAPTATVVPTVVSGGEGCASGAPKVTWYVGLGAGTDADVMPKEKAWVDSFNKNQADACVILQIVHNPESYDTLKAMIAAGTPPDIVGPVGKQGRANFQGAWADISPLAQAAGFDLSKYDKALLDFTSDEGVLIGVPFALFPSFVYYNKDLFDEARLPYPPHKVGEQYQGKEWNIDTLTELAKKLTVDSSGNDATASNFDPKNIKQFGFWDGWADARRITALFGPGTPFDNQYNAKIPDNWRAMWKWHYDSMWKDYFQPNQDYKNSDLMAKGNPFASGNVAMAWTFTWYTCCFDMKKLNWDIAVVPSYNGKTTAGLHGDTFAIMKDSKNQAAAFKVLSAMVVDKELSAMYGGIPGKLEDRAAFFQTMDDRTAPNKIDWSVALEMLKYPDIPNHEAWMPNMLKAQDLFGKFYTTMDQTPGLNMDQEIDKLQADLDAVFKAK
jgi:multiple sugar transport system substrate-binding protein